MESMSELKNSRKQQKLLHIYGRLLSCKWGCILFMVFLQGLVLLCPFRDFFFLSNKKFNLKFGASLLG